MTTKSEYQCQAVIADIHYQFETFGAQSSLQAYKQFSAWLQRKHEQDIALITELNFKRIAIDFF